MLAIAHGLLATVLSAGFPSPPAQANARVPPSAQTQPALPPPAAAPRQTTQLPARLEAGVSATVLGTASLGTQPANLLAPDGNQLPLFRTDNDVGPGAGLRATFAVRMRRRLAAEFGAGWTRTSLRARVSGDFEGAGDITLTDGVDRYTVEGAAVVTWRVASRANWFVRAGGGWLREVEGAHVLADNGLVANVGGGVKYWWLDARGRERLWLRLEARAEAFTGGVAAGEGVWRVVPGALVGLVAGF